MLKRHGWVFLGLLTCHFSFAGPVDQFFGEYKGICEKEQPEQEDRPERSQSETYARFVILGNYFTLSTSNNFIGLPAVTLGRTEREGGFIDASLSADGEELTVLNENDDGSDHRYRQYHQIRRTDRGIHLYYEVNDISAEPRRMLRYTCEFERLTF